MYLDGQRKQIIEWVQQGLNDRQIAEQCRVSPSTVRYWRERNGVTRPAKTKDSPGSQDKPTSGNNPTDEDA